ncbi:MAG: hypothetical protein ACK55I_49655, partial [bacterium]
LRGHEAAVRGASDVAAPLGAGAAGWLAASGALAAGGFGPAGAGGLGWASLQAATDSTTRGEARSTIRRAIMLLG